MFGLRARSSSGAQEAALSKAEGFGELKTESARARSFCFKSERTSVPSGTPRSERERAKTETMSLGTRMFKQKGSETGGGT